MKTFTPTILTGLILCAISAVNLEAISTVIYQDADDLGIFELPVIEDFLLVRDTGTATTTNKDPSNITGAAFNMLDFDAIDRTTVRYHGSAAFNEGIMVSFDVFDISLEDGSLFRIGADDANLSQGANVSVGVRILSGGSIVAETGGTTITWPGAFLNGTVFNLTVIYNTSATDIDLTTSGGPFIQPNRWAILVNGSVLDNGLARSENLAAFNTSGAQDFWWLSGTISTQTGIDIEFDNVVLTTGEDILGASPSSLRINEIRIDSPADPVDPGINDTDEYAELKGTPGASLNGYWYLVIGDGPDNFGIIEQVIDLSGYTIPSDGYFLISTPTLTTGLPGDIDYEIPLNSFENNDNVTHLVVRDFTGALLDDIDTFNTGIPDILPWSEIVDVVGLVANPFGGDGYYGFVLGGTDIGPNVDRVPAHIYRNEDSGEWLMGTFSTLPEDGAQDTPGGPNPTEVTPDTIDWTFDSLATGPLDGQDGWTGPPQAAIGPAPVGASTNLLVNGDFESGDLAGWNASFGASVSSFFAEGGTYSLEISAGGLFSVPVAFQRFPASPGDEFNLSGYLYTAEFIPPGATFGLFKIVFKDAFNNDLEPASVSIGQFGPPANPGAESLPFLDGLSPPGVWIFSQAQAMAPPGTTEVAFFALNVDESASIMYFDSIQAVNTQDGPAAGGFSGQSLILNGDPLSPMDLWASNSLPGAPVSFSMDVLMHPNGTPDAEELVVRFNGDNNFVSLNPDSGVIAVAGGSIGYPLPYNVPYKFAVQFTVVGGTATAADFFINDVPIGSIDGLVIDMSSGPLVEFRSQNSISYVDNVSFEPIIPSCVPPALTIPPASQSVCPGETAEFFSDAVGSAPLSYQWYKDGLELDGETGQSLSIQSVTPDDAGSYHVVVTNACGSDESEPVTLTVEDLPPVVNLNGPDLVFLSACTETYAELGATAQDPCEGLLDVIIGGDTVDSTTQGSYTVSYSATDSTGNTTTVYREVFVSDAPPQFTVIPNPLELNCSDPNLESLIEEWLASAEASDDCGIQSLVNDFPGLTSCSSGDIRVRWTATDTAGQQVSAFAVLKINPDGPVSGMELVSNPARIFQAANLVGQSAIEVINNGDCPVLLTDFSVSGTPGGPIVTLDPIFNLSNPLVCPDEILAIGLNVDTSGSPEGSYNYLINLSGPEGEASIPVEVVVNDVALPDLTGNYPGGGIRIIPAESPVFPSSGEDFEIELTLRNAGAADAGAFAVRFFTGIDELLGEVTVEGLAAGQETMVSIPVAGGWADGFYLLRTEILPPEIGEISLSNNASSALLQVGNLPGTEVDLIVQANATPPCDPEDPIFVSGRAYYQFTTLEGSINYPVKGGAVFLTLDTQDPITGIHTDTSGNFSGYLPAQPPGSYTLLVEVTDFTVSGTTSLDMTLPADCPEPGGVPASPGTPPFLGGGALRDLYLCSGDILVTLPDGGPLDPTAAPPGQLLIGTTLHYYASDGSAIPLQPVSFTAYEQLGGNVIEHPIGTRAVAFSGGGSAQVSVPWTPPNNGTFIIKAEVNPTISQGTGNDSATSSLIVGPEPGPAEIVVRATLSNPCNRSLQFVAGTAVYTAATGDAMPVICGEVTVDVFNVTDGAMEPLGLAYTRTDQQGNFAIYPRVIVPPGDALFIIQVTDGVRTGEVEHFVTCEEIVEAPSRDTPPDDPVDIFIYAEDIGLIGANCLDPILAWPRAGEAVSVAAFPHYFTEGTEIPSAVPVNVSVLVPSGTELIRLPVGDTVADWTGDGLLCVPWTPQVTGPQILEVTVQPGLAEPPINQYTGNDAATRLVYIGEVDCQLSVDPAESQLNPGTGTSLLLEGISLSGNTTQLALQLQFQGDAQPEGLVVSLESATIPLPGSTHILVEAASTTPAGNYTFVVIGSAPSCNALTTFGIRITDTAPPEIECPQPRTLTADSDGYVTFPDLAPLAVISDNATPVDQIEVIQDPEAGTAIGIGIHVVTLTATDLAGNSSSCTTSIEVEPPEVENTAPVVVIEEPYSGLTVPVNQDILFKGSFTDDDPAGSHTGEWIISSPNLNESFAATIDGYSVEDVFSFGQPGIYHIQLTVTDPHGASGSADTVLNDLPAYIVVYDPYSGFVTGGGWIWSPEGALMPGSADFESVAGKANFGFTLKYKKGSETPSGNVLFEFHMGEIHLKSEAFNWLMITGNLAQFEGTGTINGEDTYGFLMTIVDDTERGRLAEDKLRIKIWDTASGIVIYDNQPGSPDDAELGEGTIIVGGNLTIHGN